MLKVIIHAVPRQPSGEPFESLTKRLTKDLTLVDNMIEVQEVPDTEKYELKEMQGIVGGLIDILSSRIDCGTPVAMIINDMGKLEDLPVNPLATILAIDYGMMDESDFIVGDVLLAYDTGDDVRPFAGEEYARLRPHPADRLMQYKILLMLNKE